MERLLRWGLENTPAGTSEAPSPSRQPLDPGVIDAILGKSDAEQMKDDMAVALDSSKKENERVEALDHFEMLVENIDNASDLERIGLWPPLHSLLSAHDTPNSVVLQALWAIGTALQNNPAAQDAYMKLNPIPDILAFSQSSMKVRAKVVYAISGLLKHNAPAIEQMREEDWKALRSGLSDPDIQTRRKTIFLLNALIIPNSDSLSDTTASNASAALHSPASTSAPVHPNSHASSTPHRSNTSPPTCSALIKYDIVSHIVKNLVDPVPWGVDGENDGGDDEFEEKALRFLHTFIVDCKVTLADMDATKLKDWLARHKFSAELAEKWNMTSNEFEHLKTTLN
ncbi:adenyl-nucleotide exchange factor [Flagelloscypha sp. PMI_526]|nr:adenyl-nucleotide exchange factor [Flagelloscypha sp. PMI_526]